MPLAPAIGAALALGLPSRAKALWVDGLDVLGSSSAGYGVAPESIELLEAGPGQVSALSFTLTDPLVAVTLTKGARVTFMDITRNVPLFTGFVDSYPYDRLGLGRVYRVTCVGIEIVLDWMKVPGPLTLAATTDTYGAIASAVAAATGVGVSLRYGWSATGTSSLALPFILTTPNSQLGYAVTLSGVTLRDAITQIIQSANASIIQSFGIVTGDWRVTVDPYGGLRSWDLTNNWAGDTPSDWATLTVAGPTRYPSNTSLEAAGAEVRGVYVQGGNTAGSGLTMDGTGLPGEVALISETASLTDSSRQAVAQRYLAANAPVVSGTFDLEENVTVGSIGSEIRAGGKVTVTDANMGLSAYAARISQIVKHFWASGLETWTVSFGNERPSASQYVRQLTRSVKG